MEAIVLPALNPEACYPLTITRSLAEMPVANKTLLQAQIEALEAADFEHVHLAEDEDINPYIAPDDGFRLVQDGDVWLSGPDLRRLRRKEVHVLTSPVDGRIVASIAGYPSDEVVSAPLSDESFELAFPWDFLRLNDLLLSAMTENLIAGELSPAAHVDGVLALGEGSRVLPGVYIEGHVSIGRNCKIGPNCYLRGPTAIGDGCHIGQAVEVKASIIMADTSAAHLSYIGDSIIGTECNLGAGTITANLRHDGSNNRSMVGDQLVDTGRRKLGVIIGDHAHLGINTAIYPGRKIWPHGVTVPGEVVRQDIITDAG